MNNFFFFRRQMSLPGCQAGEPAARASSSNPFEVTAQALCLRHIKEDEFAANPQAGIANSLYLPRQREIRTVAKSTKIDNDVPLICKVWPADETSLLPLTSQDASLEQLTHRQDAYGSREATLDEQLGLH